MNTRIGLLGGILSAQILIFAVVLVSSGLGESEEAAGLLSFEPAETTGIVIATAEEEVTLSRGDDGWQLADGLPADDGKVGEVLEKIAEVSAAWPVATSAASAERFEVTEDNFQRRLDIESESGEVARLYLGSSPGYRRVHARADGADEVYSIDFSNYEAPADAGQWLDKQLLRPSGEVKGVTRENGWTLAVAEIGTEGAGTPTADPSADVGVSVEVDNVSNPAESDQPAQAAGPDVDTDAVAGADTGASVGAGAGGDAGASADDGSSADSAADSVLPGAGESDSQSDGGSAVANLGGLVDDGAGGGDSSAWLVDGALADDEAAERLVGRFADLNVLGIAETEGDPKGSFTIQDADGEYRLDLYFDEEEDDYSVVSSRVDGRFEIATYIAEQMLIDADDLLPQPEEPDVDDEPDSDIEDS